MGFPGVISPFFSHVYGFLSFFGSCTASMCAVRFTFPWTFQQPLELLAVYRWIEEVSGDWRDLWGGRFLEGQRPEKVKKNDMAIFLGSLW